MRAFAVAAIVAPIAFEALLFAVIVARMFWRAARRPFNEGNIQ